jgi:hypothetical protein
MTHNGTVQRRKEGIESALICAIGRSEKRDLREEKALADFGLTGHSENHIQSALSIPLAPPSLTP